MMATAPVSQEPPASNSYGLTNHLDYNLRFTADISKQMQMPDRLVAADDQQNGGFVGPSSYSLLDSSPAFGMTMPDKLFLGETEFNLDHPVPTVDGMTNDEVEVDKRYEPKLLSGLAGVNSTPQKQKHDSDLFAAGEMVVPATPGSMLQTPLCSIGSGPLTDWLTIQRQVAKLTCRVERLEEENGRRRQCEWLILYPLLLGLGIVELARFLMARVK